MAVDFLLKIIGGDPSEFTDAADKWAEVLLILSGPGSYVIMAIIFLLPFGYVAARRKPFNKKNLIVSITVGIVLAIITKSLIEWGLLALIGLSIQQLYGV
jgi:hypothetical protein